MKIIPVIHCFDNNYVLPAAVAFYSLLENADSNYFYRIYVLHNDITKENQKKLVKSTEKFKNSEIIFIDMKNKFLDIWEKVKAKEHFSKEMFYKLLTPSIFKEYEKIILSDVDVIYFDDISKEFLNFDINENFYFAGISGIGKRKYFINLYKIFFSDEKIKKLKYGAGYLIMNLKKCREDLIENKFFECLENNIEGLKQPEQDILNLCCYPYIKSLPLRNMVCTYMYDEYGKEKEIYSEIYKSKEEIEEALKSPVQLHYATGTKPWKNLNCTKSKEWFKYLLETSFAEEFFDNIQKKYIDKPNKLICRFSVPFSVKRKLIFTLEKSKKIKK